MDHTWWCTKSSVSWLSAHMPIRVPEKQENKEPTESISAVPANNPPKVKSVIKESPITQECEC